MNGKVLLFSAFVNILWAVPCNAQVDNYRPYHSLLARQCAANHLEWISPSDLFEIIAKFHDSLAASEKRKVDRANDQKSFCANVTMGATCFNVAALRAMTKAGLLSKFAKHVCSTGLVCKEQSDCSQP